jgi:hypothetical protein
LLGIFRYFASYFYKPFCLHSVGQSIEHFAVISVAAFVSVIATSIDVIIAINNGTMHFKKCKQLFEYLHLLLLRDIWWFIFSTPVLI